MPTYEYVCTECLEKIEVSASLAEKEKGLKVVCPKCGGTKTAQLFGSVSVLKGSRGNSSAPMCGPGSGPSCCG